MGGNLTTFDKDHGIAEEGRSRRFLQPSHTAPLQLPYTVGGDQARLDTRTEFKISQHSLKGGVKLVVQLSI